jgi:O-antigen ligase
VRKSGRQTSHASSTNRTDRTAVLALVVSLILLTLAVLFGGMSAAAPASLFSTASMASIIVIAALRPTESLGRALQALAIPAFFYSLFLAYAVFSITPLSMPFAHPKWASMALQGPLSLSPFRTLEGISASISQAGFALLGALCVDKRADRDRIGRGLTIMSLLLVACALFWLIADVAENRRLRLRLDSANAAATMFGMLAIVAMTLWMRGFNGRLRAPAMAMTGKLEGLQKFITAPVSLAAFVFCIACVIMTASRGGILAGLAGLITLSSLLVVSQRAPAGESKGKVWRPALALGGVALSLVLFGGQFLFERFDRIQDNSNRDRQITIETHWQAFQDRPLWGHGLNTFHAINETAATPKNWQSIYPAGSAHNIYVQALEEGGLIGGGLLFLAFGALIVKALWRALNAPSGRDWAAAAFAASLLALLHGLVDFGLNVPAISALLCFMLGAFIVRTRRTNENGAEAL